MVGCLKETGEGTVLASFDYVVNAEKCSRNKRFRDDLLLVNLWINLSFLSVATIWNWVLSFLVFTRSTHLILKFIVKVLDKTVWVRTRYFKRLRLLYLFTLEAISLLNFVIWFVIRTLAGELFFLMRLLKERTMNWMSPEEIVLIYVLDLVLDIIFFVFLSWLIKFFGKNLAEFIFAGRVVPEWFILKWRLP